MGIYASRTGGRMPIYMKIYHCWVRQAPLCGLGGEEGIKVYRPLLSAVK